MTQASASTPPSAASCAELLRAMPALTALKRVLYREAPHDLRGTLGALSIVARHPDGVRASKVADLLHVDLSVASRALSQLDERGYIRREPDPVDGRASIARLEPAGREWLDGFVDQFAGQMRGYLADWAEADVAQLTTLLHRFNDTLEGIA